MTPIRIASIALVALLSTAVRPALAPAAPPAAAADSAGVAADSAGTAAPRRHGASDQERQELKDTMRHVGRNEVAGARQWERRKNPRVAMLANALLPGLGQTYNGRRLKVAVMVGFFSFYSGNMVLSWQRHQYYEALRDLSPPGSSSFELNDQLSLFYEEQAKDFLWWSAAVWLIGILDAWVDAHLYDVRAYTPETPAAPDPGRIDGAGMRLGVGERGGDRYLTFTFGF